VRVAVAGFAAAGGGGDPVRDLASDAHTDGLDLHDAGGTGPAHPDFAPLADSHGSEELRIGIRKVAGIDDRPVTLSQAREGSAIRSTCRILT
jgi:hypothetical protein